MSSPVLVLGHCEAWSNPADQVFIELDPVQVLAVNTEPRTGLQATVHSGVFNNISRSKTPSLQLSSPLSCHANQQRDCSTRLTQ